MRCRRRTLLSGSLGMVGAMTLGSTSGCARPDQVQTAVLLPSRAPLPPRFVSPFVVPPVKRPLRQAQGTGTQGQGTGTGGDTTYEIVQRLAPVEILPGLTTQVMGYDGLFPGPTITARRGERVVVRHRNELPVPTVVHLHGGHTPAMSDGYPVDLVLPATGWTGDHHGGATGDVSQGERDYVYPHDQPAATLWYHDHRMDFTAPQVWRGLAGFHLVTDEVEDALDLPAGDRDVPLMIMDRAFEADGALSYPSLDARLTETPGVRRDYISGVLGDVILVNGRPWPAMEVAAVRYRFRILNASNARRYRLGLSPAPPAGSAFTQIGSDGGLLAAPLTHDVIAVSPAERFDVVIDFGAYPVGTEVTMTNALGTGSTDAVMRFLVTRAAPDPSRIPDRLAVVEPLGPPPGAPVREWRFTRGSGVGLAHWTINQLAFDPDRMDARPRLGETEIWRFYSDLHHPVHVHLSPFQVLARGNGGPGEFDHGWKDTVDLRPAEHVDVAVRFTDYAGAFVLHCHNLEHEDMMMMAAYETVA